MKIRTPVSIMCLSIGQVFWLLTPEDDGMFVVLGVYPNGLDRHVAKKGNERCGPFFRIQWESFVAVEAEAPEEATPVAMTQILPIAA